ncbi:MAG: NAD(P)/FAD-dependent oxidoreductase [Gammaproteobacteria bacterium]|nr:NAD(P)/FAD-dependent oxidoreductase [Gammaproteobacteria bacterium]
MNDRRVVVVGGGTAGLMAGYTLKKRGIEPIVLEEKDRAGGRLGGDRVDGFCIDEAADWFTTAHDVVLDLCDELELPMMAAEQTAAWHRRGKYLVTRHADVKPMTVLRNMVSAAQMGLMSPRSILALLKIVNQISKWKNFASFASDATPVEADTGELFVDYMARIGAPEDLVMLIRCFMEDAMGDFQRMSSVQVLAYVSQILMKGHLLRVPEKGIGSIAHALSDRIGDGLRVSAPVRHIEIQDGVASTVNIEGENGESIKADAVICATTSTIATRIIPGLPQPIVDALGKVEYSVGCRIVFGLEHSPLPDGLTAVMFPEDETPLMLDRSSYLRSCVPPGTATLDLMIGRVRARELLPLDDDEIKSQALAVARRMAPPGSKIPQDGEGIFSRVYRWPEATAITPPGVQRAVANALHKHGDDIPNLFLAGEYTRMPSINGAITSGRDAANEAADYLNSLPND